MLAQMSAAQLRGWMAYYNIEPWGEDRGDLRAGIVAATVANAFRKKGSRPMRPADFMPQFDAPYRPPPDPQDLFRKLQARFALYQAQKE